MLQVSLKTAPAGPELWPFFRLPLQAGIILPRAHPVFGTGDSGFSPRRVLKHFSLSLFFSFYPFTQKATSAPPLLLLARNRVLQAKRPVLTPPSLLRLLPLIAQRQALVLWIRLVALSPDPSLAFPSLRSVCRVLNRQFISVGLRGYYFDTCGVGRSTVAPGKGPLLT